MCAQVPFTADAVAHLPSTLPTRHPQYNSIHRARLQVPVTRMLRTPWFEVDRRSRRATRRPKNGQIDPFQRDEQQRSSDINAFLQNLVALSEPWAALVLAINVFKRFLTRAPFAPKAEESVAKAVRNQILHHKLAKYKPKWGAWLVRDVGFPDAKLMISCCHDKLTKQVLVGPF